MRNLLLNLLFFPVTVEFVIGNVVNGFIVLMNCIDWVKRHKISSVDQILTALALSRIGLYWAMVTNWYIARFYSSLCTSEAIITIHIAWILSNHFSIWFATSLSIFYLFKIANFSNSFFLYFKRRVKGVVVAILLGSLTVLGTQLAVATLDNNVRVTEYKRNMTLKTAFEDQIRLSNMAVFTLENCIPFTISLMCFVLLIFSLMRHLRKMQLSGRGDRDPNTQVHIRALKTVISFLLLFACYFLALIISAWGSNRLRNKYVLLFGEIIFELYPSGHSFILIWGNKKLKEAFLGFLWSLMCCLRGRE
ncbi:taste receptor type 2 member 19-like [Erinaceus europaeus]|uniref:Taste receptor type 2 n=1 Tax=Erinaceus europaeus TaxID=9365 RepID=A0A1S2Z9C7_ERIEU|nr:taste receptor type 2 member 19-like [Erinaceus europaeus]